MYSIKEYTVFSTLNQKIYYLRNKKLIISFANIILSNQITSDSYQILIFCTFEKSFVSSISAFFFVFIHKMHVESMKEMPVDIT